MKLKITNNVMISVTNFMIAVELSGKASRMRTRLVDKLNEQWVKVREEVIKEPDETIKEEILQENSIIDVSEWENFVPIIYSGLEEAGNKFGGTDAVLYDMIMTILEESMGE